MRLRSLSGRRPKSHDFGYTENVSLTERQRCQPCKLVRWVRLLQDTLGDRLTVGYRSLTPTMEVRILLPDWCTTNRTTSGQLRLVAIPGSEPGGVGSIPTPGNAIALRITEVSRLRLLMKMKTEVIRPDEEPVLKTGGGASRLWVRVPRLPLNVARLSESIGIEEGSAQRAKLRDFVVRAGGWPGHDGGRSTVPIGMLRIGTRARPRSSASPVGRWKHRSE